MTFSPNDLPLLAIALVALGSFALVGVFRWRFLAEYAAQYGEAPGFPFRVFFRRDPAPEVERRRRQHEIALYAYLPLTILAVLGVFALDMLSTEPLVPLTAAIAYVAVLLIVLRRTA